MVSVYGIGEIVGLWLVIRLVNKFVLFSVSVKFSVLWFMFNYNFCIGDGLIIGMFVGVVGCMLV